MKRVILLRELRVGAFQELIAGGILLAIFALAGNLAMSKRAADEAQVVLSTILIALILLAGFSSGARAFSPEHRRRQELFLYVLPASRQSIWLCLAAGRFAPALAMAVVVVLASPLIHKSFYPRVDWSAWAVSLYLALFAAGCCLSLLVRRDLTAYVVAVPVFGYMSAQLFVFVVLDFSSTTKLVELQALLWSGSMFLMSVVLLVLSLYFFRRGETHVLRCRITNQLCFAVALTSVLLLAGGVMQSPTLDELTGPWAEDNDYIVNAGQAVSPSGRYLAVIEKLKERPVISRIVIIETNSGRVVGKRRFRQLQWMGWDRESEVLVAFSVRGARPFFWRTWQTDWLLLDPTGQKLSSGRFGEQVLEVMSLRDGSGLLLLEVDNRGLVFGDVDIAERPPLLAEKPAMLPEAGFFVHFSPLRGQGALVDTSERDWHIVGGGAQEATFDRFVKQHRSFSDKVKAMSGQTLGRTLAVEPDGLRSSWFLAVSPLPDKIALYSPAGGAGDRVTLYDGTLDRELPLPGCAGRRAVAPRLIPAENSQAFLVCYECRPASASGLGVEYRYFSYLPGSGSLKPFVASGSELLARGTVFLGYLDERTVIWRSQSDESWRILRHGRVRTLWPPRP